MDLKDMFFISEKDWLMLIAWAKLAYDEDKNEISGLLTAIPQEDGRYKLGDVEILKQENTSSTTELEAEAVAEYKMKYAMKHKNKNMKYVWWHSHHTMGAFWSGTDLKEINAWKNNSFSLALVVNLKQEYVFRVSVWSASGIPIEKHYDIPLDIERTSKIKITEKMKTLYEELCDDGSISNVVSYQNGKRWNGYGYQTNLYKGKSDYDKYHDIKISIENLVDSFMTEEITFEGFKEELGKQNKKCKNLPFKIRKLKTNKNDTLTALMTTSPEEFFDFEDNSLKFQFEQRDDWTYGGWM